MIIYSLSTALIPLLGLALWFTTSNFSNLPYTKFELLAYFMAVLYVGTATGMWQSWYINESINNGNFSAYIIKPISIFERYLTELLSDASYKVMVISLLLPISYIFIPREVWGQFSINFVSLSLFAVSVIVGFMVLFFIELSIGLSSVWFYDIDFLKGSIDVTNLLFAGKFVPLVFLPPFLSNVAIFLPFRYAVSFPVEILLHRLSNQAIIFGFTIEFFYFAVTFIIYNLILKMFLKNYKGYGA